MSNNQSLPEFIKTLHLGNLHALIELAQARINEIKREPRHTVYALNTESGVCVCRWANLQELTSRLSEALLLLSEDTLTRPFYGFTVAEEDYPTSELPRYVTAKLPSARNMANSLLGKY